MRLILVAVAAFVMLVPSATAQKIVAPTQSAPSPAPSQPPTPMPSDQPKNQRDLQQPNTEERGTENVPLIVKIIPTKPSPEQEQRENDKIELDRQTAKLTADLVAYTKLLFVATAILATATGGLALVAFLQMRESRGAIRAAENAAKAAERHASVAEQTFVDLERPYLFYEHIRMEDPITIEWCDPSIESLHKTIQVFYDIKNYGRTPAIVTEHGNSIYIGRDLPDHPLHHRNDIWNVEYVIGTVRPDDIRELQVFYRGDVTQQLIGELYLGRSVEESGTKLFFFAYVKYNSAQGARDEVGVCYEYFVDINQFIQRDIQRYTYRKRGDKPAPPHGMALPT